MPLARVREIHVSGGSWWTGTVDPARPFRRDDDPDLAHLQAETATRAAAIQGGDARP